MSLRGTIWAWRAKTLTTPERCILAYLGDAHRDRDRTGMVTKAYDVETIAAAVHMSPRNVMRVTAALAERQVIRIHRRGRGNVNHYQLIGLDAVVLPSDDVTPVAGQAPDDVTPVADQAPDDLPDDVTPVAGQTDDLPDEVTNEPDDLPDDVTPVSPIPGYQDIPGTKDKESRARARSLPAAAVATDPPPGLNLAAWNAWVEYRRAIRKPLRSASVLAAQKRLVALGDAAAQAEAVERSIANGYQGLFAAPTAGRARSTTGDGRMSEAAARTMAAAQEWLNEPD
jgi:hypothetical protein